jgi:hypothetical protein
MSTTAIKPVPSPAIAPVAPPAPKRMTLEKVVTGLVQVPDRILIYGIEGIGKSTFAAGFPAPIFIEAERDGTARIETTRFPTPERWPDILEAVQTLAIETHEYKTVIIDTLDAAEAMIWQYIIKRDGKKAIEDYPYGQGYTAAVDQWRILLAGLERLRVKGMGIVLIGHSSVKTFNNPEGPNFDRYQLKLNDKAGGLLRGWCDAFLFANYETLTQRNEQTKQVKGVSSGARVIHTLRTAAYDAKSRLGLPEMLPLNYDDFAAAVTRQQPRDPAALRADLIAKASELGDANITKLTTEFIDKVGDDAIKLSELLNRVNALLLKKMETTNV